MVFILILEHERVKSYRNVNILTDCAIENVIWVDLLSPEPEEKKVVELVFQVRLRTRQEVEEIESSSRYFETDDFIVANSNFLVLRDAHYVNEPVSFILKNNTLISYRSSELKSFAETFKKLDIFPKISGGPSAFIMLFETRIDLDADLIEGLAKEIAEISKKVTLDNHMDESLILHISKYQETAMLVRENIIDKQRVISAILKSDYFPKETYEKLRIMVKDISSLLDHITFSFARLEYLQNTFLGLVNIEQNKIIKIFTVATVAFMPPTLIASIYGMNFKRIPELGWIFGYPFAIILMFASSLFALYFFKRKKWL